LGNEQIRDGISRQEKKGYYDNDLFPGKILGFLKSKNSSIEAIVNCCMASDHSGDGILVERWNKEFQKDGRNTFLY